MLEGSGIVFLILFCRISLAAEGPPDKTPGAVQGSLLSIELAEARGGPEGGAAILEGLRNPAAQVRARAARAAGRWGAERWDDFFSRRVKASPGAGGPPPPGPVPLLADLALNDRDLEVRREAAFALGQIGDPSSSAALSALALDPSPSLRERALEALAKLPGTPPGLIATALADPAPGPRGAAALALAWLLSPRPGAPPAGAAGAEAGEDLGKLIAERLDREEDGRARWKLAYLVSRRPDLLLRPEIRPRLLPSFSSPNFLEAAFAAAAFEAAASSPAAAGGLLSDLASIEALERGASDPAQFWIARVACVRALTEFLPRRTAGGAEARAEVSPAARAAGQATLRLLGSPGFPGEIHHLRKALIGGLARSRGPEEALFLKKLVETGEGGDLEEAIRAAASFPELLEAAARRLQGAGGVPSERLLAALASARCAGGDAGALEAALLYPSPRVRAAALLAAPAPSSELAARALSDPDAAVRGAAAERIASGEVDVGAGVLSRALRGSSAVEFWEVRAALVTALERKGDLAILREALEDPHPTVARRARKALARAGEPSAGGGAAGASRDPEKGSPGFFSASQADFSRDPRAAIEVRGRGTVRLDLLVEEAPQAVSAFVRLARSGFYRGLSFHRVVANWVVQGGDPRGDGSGGAGFSLRDETGPEPFLRGSAGIAKLDRDDGSCQFFIAHLPAPRLDGRYTLFARVIEGMEVVDGIEEGDVILSVEVDGWRERTAR